MIEYNGFLSNLKQELSELKELEEHLTEKLKDTPEGSLNVLKKKGGIPQYYQYLGNRKRKYLPRKKINIASAIAQKECDLAVLKIITNRIRYAKKLAKAYEETEDKYYEQLSAERKALITKTFIPEQEFIDQWYKEHAGGQNSYPYTKVFYTDRGEMVRSKSEKMLADMFYKMKIPYVYEPMIILQDGKIMYPDFILLNKKLRKTIILEHLGIMNDPQYVGKAVDKIHLYERNGYWPGDKILFTMETMEDPLDVLLSKEMLRKNGLL